MTQQQKGLPTVSVRLPDDLRERLDALAITTGRPRTWYVKEAIIKHLGEIEAKYKIEQARLEQYEKTASPRRRDETSAKMPASSSYSPDHWG